MSLPAAPRSNVRPTAGFVAELRDLAISGLAHMYRPAHGLFAFRVRRRGEEFLLEGSSHRYTAIALIGLAGEDEAVQASVLAGIGVREACAPTISMPW